MYWLRKYKGGTRPTIPIFVEVLENIGKGAVKVRMHGTKCVNRIRIIKEDSLVKTLNEKRK